MSLVFLDTETTGLELHHDIWEIACAVDDGPINSFVVPHSIANADPAALEMNGYWTRGFGADVVQAGDSLLRATLKGATIVGANPAFDATRLQLRWNAQPWHYRMIDISSMAVGVFGSMAFNGDGRPEGLAGVRELLLDYYRDSGVGIPEPDHTAAGDVRALRECYRLLMKVSVL